MNQAKLLLILPLLAFLFTSSKQESQVYICVSNTATKYHFNQYCRGLSRCTHTIKKVTLSEAKQNYGRKLCGWED